MLRKILLPYIILILLIGSGNSQEFKELTRDEIKFKLLELKIQAGDTLHAFAKRYLNDPARWPELLEYNKIPSGNPDLILPGDTVKVPIEMVKDEIADIFYLKNNDTYHLFYLNMESQFHT